MKDLRIAIIGAAGTGKTTLCDSFSRIAEEKCLYYIPVERMSTQSVMDDFGFKSHGDIVKCGSVTPQTAIEFQSTLIYQREQFFRYIHGSFITDRTSIDSLIYYLIHNSFWDTEEHGNQLIKVTESNFKTFSHIIILPTGTIPIENNQVRNTNPIYHHMYGRVLDDVIYSRFLDIFSKHNPRIIRIPNAPLSIEERVEFIIKELGDQE